MVVVVVVVVPSRFKQLVSSSKAFNGTVASLGLVSCSVIASNSEQNRVFTSLNNNDGNNDDVDDDDVDDYYYYVDDDDDVGCR